MNPKNEREKAQGTPKPLKELRARLSELVKLQTAEFNPHREKNINKLRLEITGRYKDVIKV